MLNDATFLEVVEKGKLSRNDFDHRAFLRLAWLHLQSHDYDHASLRIIHTLKAHARDQRNHTLFNESATRLWIYLVFRAIEIFPYCESFAEFIDRNSYLLNKNIPYEYYSEELLHSFHAQSEWVLPDLKPYLI